VFWHSIAGAAVIGVIAMLQAYYFPGMIPIPPVK
jgi:lactate permease